MPSFVPGLSEEEWLGGGVKAAGEKEKPVMVCSLVLSKNFSTSCAALL